METHSGITRRSEQQSRTFAIVCARCMFFAVCMVIIYVNAFGASKNMSKFEDAYKRWKIRMNQPDMLESSGPGLFDCQEYQNIVKLGISALPEIMSKMDTYPDDPMAHQLWVAAARISKKRFENEEERNISSNKNRVILWQEWWKEGRFKTGAQFAILIKQWKSLKSEKNDKEADKVYRKIVNLGIPVLPYLVDNADQNPEFVPAISKLSAGDIPTTATSHVCKELWEKCKSKYELPGPTKKDLKPNLSKVDTIDTTKTKNRE